jgi:integration host factor subunit beta
LECGFNNRQPKFLSWENQAIGCDKRRKLNSMNKSELIEALAEKVNLPVRETASVTKTIIDTMSEALVKGDSIEIRGFGSFTVKKYGAYTGRNPKSGEQINVAPKKLPFFKVGKDLRERVDAAMREEKKGK